MSDSVTHLNVEELKKLAPPAELQRAPVVEGNKGLGWLTDKLSAFAEAKTPLWWKILFAITAFCATVIFPICLIYQVTVGVGAWGNNHPVMWGLDIVNFIWWVGVAHAGTLISALLFLTKQHWRTTIGRMAEAMTVFSVMMAGLYPAIHTGRPWFDWFMFPVPNSNGLWPQFKSPLMWDVFAVNTYLTVSSLFWFMGMIPDFAVLRDRSKTRVRKAIFSFLAMGWTGSARQWHNYEKAYAVLCGLCTLLVFTVSSIVGLDFCTSQIAGWHATIFPLYFVIGAVFCGFGMMLVILIPLRKLCNLENVITLAHIDKVAKLCLVSGLIIDYIYLMEFFIAWYSGDPYERWVFGHRLFGHTYIGLGWMLIGVNVGVTQLLWLKSVRSRLWLLFIIGVLINMGMWCERFVIVVGSLYQEFLPANWGKYMPTMWDIGLYIGTLGAFFMMYLLFVKFLPMIAIQEVKGAMPEADTHHKLGGANEGGHQ
jgi:molybdopterin-containing oxidoreductase family membrane subunit